MGEGRKRASMRAWEYKNENTLALPAGIIGLKYEEIDQQPMPSKNQINPLW